MRFLSVLSVFFSALLAFSVEPLIAKRLLPAFGGGAAIWVTCLVTFQGLLLLGYLYADLLLRLPRKIQLPVHAAVLLVPFLLLPFGPPRPPAGGAEPMSLLVLELLRSVALPFFALSTNSTLVQHWYAKKVGAEPWFLYATSNLGSLVGLLGYPLVIEPFLGLSVQATRWTIGYLGFALVTGAVAFAAASATTSGPPTSPRPPARQVVRWVARSAIGSILLCSVSFWVTLDVASLPLLWVVPLALYLATFILAFSSRAPFPRRYLAIFCMLFVTLGLESTLGSVREASLLLFSAFSALFCGAWLVHGDLARDRPSGDRLSAYYLWIAFGGFLGGVTGNVIAPQVFSTVAEYPLALGLLAFAVAAEKDLAGIRNTLRWPGTWAITAAMLAMLTATGFLLGTPFAARVPVLPAVVLVLGVVLHLRRPGIFGIGASLTAVFIVSGWVRTSNVLESDRSFYGTVTINERDGVRIMTHGTTVHGLEFVRSEVRAASYYHTDGPLGWSMGAFGEDAHVGVIGLGAGSLAAHSKPGQKLDFFEIDPVVERMARRWFTYLPRSPAPVKVVIGDARLELEREPDASYRGLIVDAFSSDSIPVHLLTKQALEMYFRKLEPDGVVVFHVSNRFFDLRRVLRGHADALGIHALSLAWTPTTEQFEKEVAIATRGVVVAKRSETLSPWAERGWVPLDGILPLEWTDDRSSLVPLLLDGPPPAPVRAPSTPEPTHLTVGSGGALSRSR